MLNKDEDLLDFEFFYARYVDDRPRSDEKTRAWLLQEWKEGRIYPKSKLGTRLLQWVQFQRQEKQSPHAPHESLGEELNNSFFWLCFAFALMSALLGLMSMSSYLSPGEQINITAYIFKYMLIPTALSVLALVWVMCPKAAGLLPRPLRKLTAYLIKRSAKAIHEQLGAEMREAGARQIGQILAASRQYALLLKWKFCRFFQVIFLCYFCGLMGSALYVLSSESRSFSWQTTLTQSITPERLHSILDLTSLGQSTISLQDVAESFESAELPAQLKHQWGMYCLMLILFWGIAPRLIFWLFSAYKLRRVRRSYDFTDLYYAPLTRQLMAEPIANAHGAVQELVEVPIRQAMRQALMLISPDCAKKRLPTATEGLQSFLEAQYALPIQQTVQVETQLQDETQAWQQALSTYIHQGECSNQVIFLVEDMEKSTTSSSLRRWQRLLQDRGYSGQLVCIGLQHSRMGAREAEELSVQWRHAVKKLGQRQISAESYYAAHPKPATSDAHMLLVFSPDCRESSMPSLRANLQSLLMGDGYTVLPESIQQSTLMQDPEQGWLHDLSVALTQASSVNLICPIWMSNTKGCIQKFCKKLREGCGYEGRILFTAVGTRPAGLPSEDESLDLSRHKNHISNWQHSLAQMNDDKIQFLFYL